MKKISLLAGSAGLVLSFVLLLIAYKKPKKDGLFYYAYNEKIMLQTVPDKYVIRYADADMAQARVKDAASKSLFTLAEWKDERTALVNLPDARYTAVKNALNQQSGIASITPLYTTAIEKINAAVTNEVLVRFNKGTGKQQIASLEAKFGLTLTSPNDMFNTYAVRPGENALLVANAIQETGQVEFSHPNFYMDVQMHQVPNDTYFGFQWNLHNTGQVINDGHVGTVDADIDAPEAWAKSQGSNAIIVAVLDEGVTPAHPDLPAARQVVLPGSNFSTAIPSNNPSAVGNGNHGNACAGIVAATRNNNEGVAGVAPNVRIMPIKILNPAASNANLALAIDFARNNGAHILSNSWGYGTNNPNFVPAIVTAIQNAVTLGRGGLGCVVVFAAGNTANQVGGNPGFVTFPGNVNIPGVLTVGASSRFDVQANYSPTSSGAVNNQIIDIVAPSHRAYPSQIAGETFEIWSIDIPGATGYNPWPGGTVPPAFGEILPNFGVNNQSYTGRMGGTSAACPEVAGAAALMLSVNPGLTQQRVFDMLIQTADKVGGAYNAQGFNNQMGNGRLNLNRAVSKAGSKPYVKDMPGDAGIEPNPNPTSVYWNSQDIWVCKSGTTCVSHQNPEFGQVNTIRVRVTNGGTVPNMGGGFEVLRVYWAKASTALGWPNPWNGGVLGCVSFPMGGLVGSQNVPVIAAGGSTILNFNWSPPNPNNYSCFGADKSHFCLLARIETTPFASYSFGMTFPETSNLWQNVKNNAPIAWRNVSVENVIPRVAPGGVLTYRTGVLVEGAKFSGRKGNNVNLRLPVPEEEANDPALNYANFYVSLGKLFDPWMAATGGAGDGIEVVYDPETREPLVHILRPNAVIQKIPIQDDEQQMIVLQTEQFKSVDDGKDRVLNIALHDEQDEPIGGEAFVIGKADIPVAEAKTAKQLNDALQAGVKVGVKSRTLTVFTDNQLLRNYELTDLSGNVLKKGPLTGSKQIDASGIPGGMYILNLYDDKRKQQVAKKVMIQ